MRPLPRCSETRSWRPIGDGEGVGPAEADGVPVPGGVAVHVPLRRVPGAEGRDAIAGGEPPLPVRSHGPHTAPEHGPAGHPDARVALCAFRDSLGPSPCKRGRGRASVRSSVGSAEMRELMGDIIRECVLGAFSGDPCEGKAVAAAAGVQVLLQRLDRVGSDDSIDGIVVEPQGVQNVCAAFQLLVPNCPSITPGA